jgi:hypothetical protein
MMVGRSRRIAVSCAAALGAVLIASCGRSGPPRIVTADDLVEAIQDTGAATIDLGEAPGNGFGVAGKRIGADSAEIEVFEYESEDAREAVSSMIAPEATAVGGIPMAWPDRPHIWAAGRLIVVYVGTDGGTVLLLEGILGDPITEEGEAGEAPYPPAVTAAIRSLSQELGLDPGAVEVLGYEQTGWPDTCLGLPGPEEACGEVITSGWRIRLRAGGAEYELRTDALGTAVRR